MERALEEMGVATFINGLVGKRFTFKELKNYLEVNCKPSGYIVELVKKDMTTYENNIDYMLVGSLQNKEKDILCDFDIYYLETRNKEMYITEVSWNFE